MNIAEHFRVQQVERLDLSHYCRVASGSTVDATLKRLNETGNNCAFVMQQNRLVGIFTDGDLRRTLNKGVDLYSAKVDEVMTANPAVTREDCLAADVVNLLQRLSINSILAVDENHRPVGALNMHDLLRAGLL